MTRAQIIITTAANECNRRCGTGSEQSGLIVPALAALPNVNLDIVSLHPGFCENCFRPAKKQTFEALALRNGRRSAQAAENIYNLVPTQ